jgi:AraC-like DNA-binding protein
MDKNGQTKIAEVPYRTSAGSPPGVEILDFPGLLARALGHGVDPYAPKRPTFHQLISVRSGVLRCSVDFTDHELTAGSWLWVRPGQVTVYRSDLAEVDGTVVLFPASVLSGATVGFAGVDRRAWRLPLSLTAEDADSVRRILELLESEYRQLAGPPLEVHVEVLRHLLAALVLRLAHLRGGDGGEVPGSEAFHRFGQAVERGFARNHRVEDYAKDLGYSVRTLTRATRAAAGCGAKQYIDDRVLLEAKRLLVHTELSATAIGKRIGFPDTTVFTRFFRQRVHQTPATFRAHAAGTFVTA